MRRGQSFVLVLFEDNILEAQLVEHQPGRDTAARLNTMIRKLEKAVLGAKN